MLAVWRITPLILLKLNVVEESSLYLTADEGMSAGNTCARSTRKKDQLVGNLALEATQGSKEASPEGSADGKAISPEQLRFTTTISKAMSKELGSSSAGRDPTQARHSVYRGSRKSSIDGRILVMRRYLQRTQAKATADNKACSIIDHLKDEAQNHITNMLSPSVVRLKKSSNFGKSVRHWK